MTKRFERCEECPAWYEAVCEGGGCIRADKPPAKKEATPAETEAALPATDGDEHGNRGV